MEKLPSVENLSEKAFEKAYQIMLSQGTESFITLEGNYSKVDFLSWLVEKKGYLLHGSNNQDIKTLEPRLANCAAKEFGNMIAVYAVEDPVLPTFYAIKDGEKFRGVAQSGYSTKTNEQGVVVKEYEFAVNDHLLNPEVWSDGAVYIVPRDTFVQGHNNNDEPIDEWASTIPVKPIGKIEITRTDFPYFNSIKAIDA